MRAIARGVAGLLAVLGLGVGSAWAGQVVYTSQGWYRVEGPARTPAPNATPQALQVVPAPPPAPPVSTPPPASGIRAMPVIRPGRCLVTRGALARRLLALRGLEVSQTELSDTQLGELGLPGYGAPLPFSTSLSLDPDLDLLAGNLPIPLGAASDDWEVRSDWVAYARCMNGQ